LPDLAQLVFSNDSPPLRKTVIFQGGGQDLLSDRTLRILSDHNVVVSSPALPGTRDVQLDAETTFTMIFREPLRMSQLSAFL
jgi:hypothetical protein